MAIDAFTIKEMALDCGFELAGIAPAAPSEDFERFEAWRAQGMAGEMGYLTDRRGDLRGDPRHLLPAARSIVCVAKVYNTEYPLSIEANDKSHGRSQGWISRYAWGADYHAVLRRQLERLVAAIGARHGEPFQSRICVDTAPLLERSYARLAGLGWIGKNTCLINQEKGSWVFLGEVLLSIPLTADAPAPERCGSCTRCIEACPTHAIVENGEGGWMLDARVCISYLTIEKRGAVAAELSALTGNHLFGCDICQDVCPWNRRAAITEDEAFAPEAFGPTLASLAELTEEEFRRRFRHTPVWRAKYTGFLRNAAHAMGNSGRAEMLEALDRLTHHGDEVVREAAGQAIDRLTESLEPA